MNFTTAIKFYCPCFLCPFCNWTTNGWIKKEDAFNRWKEHLKETKCYKSQKNIP